MVYFGVDVSGDIDRFDRLYERAAEQAGFFTAEQAQQAGYSRQLLQHHLATGRVERWLRGIYRLVHFPQVSEHEDLVMYWLWSGREGVFSHETALSLHGLSDVLPARAHMTLPSVWSRRRLSAPAAVQMDFDDVPLEARSFVDRVPVTGVARTLVDCAAAGVAPDLLRQALEEALERKLVVARDVRSVRARLQAYAA